MALLVSEFGQKKSLKLIIKLIFFLQYKFRIKILRKINRLENYSNYKDLKDQKIYISKKSKLTNVF